MNSATPLSTTRSRDRFRPHALDGALLWYQPSTGRNVRFDGPETRPLRRRAPRLVLFGITNRCNLDCAFCSRDLGAPSLWTADEAFDVLSGLERLGTLEVSFGGGEPLAFKGFDDLVERLFERTRLSIHLTTNGTLFTSERARRLAPRLGEVRLSIYDGSPWEDRARLLREFGVRFGANLLVDPRRVPSLPSLFARFAALGFSDVAVLRYVGADASLRLSPSDEALFTAAVETAPLRVQISGCFGDRLHEIPRLHGNRADCGAGTDFVTLTPDKKLKACSFHGAALEVRSAEDVLRVWESSRPVLSSPAGRDGCARPEVSEPARTSDGVRIWSTFSGNNSGSCVLVGRFEEEAGAEAYLSLLRQGYAPGVSYPDEWRRALEAEDIRLGEYSVTPDAIARAGRAVLVLSDFEAEDGFPELRALLWKRGGEAVYNGIHEHDDVKLVAGVSLPSPEALARAEVKLAVDGQRSFARKGLSLFGAVDVQGEDLGPALSRLEEIAKGEGGAVAAELFPFADRHTVGGEISKSLARKAPDQGERWVWVNFRDESAAGHFSKSLGGAVKHQGRYLLSRTERHQRLGMLAVRMGGTATILEGETLVFSVVFWAPAGGKIDPGLLTARLRLQLPASTAVRLSERGVHELESTSPAETLASIVEFARAYEDRQLWISVESTEPLARLLGRLERELGG